MKEPGYEYKGEFNPRRVERTEAQVDAADLRRSPVYVYNEDITLRVNVALATRRPILVRGPSGCGKSSLARSAASVFGWRYYERVITSRTRARDLLWEVDLLRRLHDAQVPHHELSEDYTPYIVPGVLWWAFKPETARWRGPRSRDDLRPLADPSGDVQHPRAVVLIDEIDKADPDVPNNLLVPLGSLQFQVEETGITVDVKKEHAPLVFITTNDERELPSAFLRRCVSLELEWPTPSRLIEIGEAHFPDLAKGEVRKIAGLLLGRGQLEAAEKEDRAVEISPAEFIDTLRAVCGLRAPLKDKLTIDAITEATVWKHGRKRGEAH
jgi:MoxR-like ATPase